MQSDTAPHPDATIFFGDRSRTFAEIDERAARAAEGFRRAGVTDGETVALLMRNDFALFEASLAATKAGASPVPLNWNAEPDDVAYILRDCGARAIVVHADLLRRYRSCLPDCTVLVVDTPPEVHAAFGIEPLEPPGRLDLWNDWIDRHSPIREPPAKRQTPVIYTSGTTGRPKGVRRTGDAGSSGSAKALRVYGFDLDGPIKALINGPLYHSVPNAFGRLAMQAGADIVLEARFDPEEMLALIARHRVTHMHIVPAMMTRLLQLADDVRLRFDCSSLRHVVHGAAPCPRDVKRAMLDWWGPVIHEYYGSTETGLLTLATPDDFARKPGSVGRALPGVTLKVLDDRGAELGVGAHGDVYAGSSTLHAFTYIGQDEKRAAIGRADLVTAGDIGWLDEDGYLFLGDRKRDAIRIDGRIIFPSRIEAVVLTGAGVRDCAVFAIERDVGEPTICLCIEPKPGASVSAEALRRHVERAIGCETELRVEIRASLPREDSGKIFKTRLRRALEEEDTDRNKLS